MQASRSAARNDPSGRPNFTQKPDSSAAAPPPCRYTDKSDTLSEVQSGSASHAREGAPRTRGPGVTRCPSSNVPPRGRAARVVGTHATLSKLELERLPKHVRKCFNGTRQHHYVVYTWDPADPSKKTRIPYTCGSWRCPGACARFEASVTFARMREAIQRPDYNPAGWVVFVLTIDREGYYSGEPWKNADEAYRRLGEMTAHFLLSLRRYQERVEWRRSKNEWLAVVEAHRTGWPHMNVVIYAPELARELERERLAFVGPELEARRLAALAAAKVKRLAALAVIEAVPSEEEKILLRRLPSLIPLELTPLEQERIRQSGLIGGCLSAAEKELVARRVALANERRRRRKAGEVLDAAALEQLELSEGDRDVWREIRQLRGTQLLTMLCRAGWGVQSSAERAHDREALAGYLVKLAASQDSAAGEVAKITQAPRVAPERFRRLRSGVKFLPPRHESGKTGAIIRRVWERDGTVRAEPVHNTPPHLIPHVQACCYHEEDLAVTELAARMQMAADPGAAILKELLAEMAGKRLSSRERGYPDLIHTFNERATGPPKKRDTS